MSRFRFRDDEGSNTTTILAVLAGAVGGFALGMYVAQRVGGIEGLTSKLKKMKGRGPGEAPRLDSDADEFEDVEEDEFASEGDEGLEDHVLEAFRNDPILAERAVDIGAIGEDTIELAGWVDTDQEALHAVTIARGVPGVSNVVNRLSIGAEEAELEETAKRSARGDATFSERGWDGNTIGTGRRRQGNSAELDRHVDPRTEKETKLASTDDALRDAAEESGGSAPRYRAGKTVPSADHVSKAD